MTACHIALYLLTFERACICNARTRWKQQSYIEDASESLPSAVDERFGQIRSDPIVADVGISPKPLASLLLCFSGAACRYGEFRCGRKLGNRLGDGTRLALQPFVSEFCRRNAERVNPLSMISRHASAKGDVTSDLGRHDLGDDEDYDDEDQNAVNFVVTSEEAGSRLDVVLAQHFAEQGRSRNYYGQLVKNGAVTCNGKLEKKSFKPSVGDEIIVRFQWLPVEELKLRPEELLQLDLKNRILYEDEDIVVINKPINSVVHPAPGNWNGTIINGMLHYFQESNAKYDWEHPNNQRPGVVHRLDKDTTGCLAIAKNSIAEANLARSFAERKVRKQYACVAFGQPESLEEDVITLIGRDPTNRLKMKVFQDGTQYKARIAESTVHTIGWNDRFSLLRVDIHTGRTHQIRVHLGHLNCPVVGDEVYGRADLNKLVKKNYGVAQILLHAHRLSFPHPIRESEIVSVEAPLPDDFHRVVSDIIGTIPPERLATWRDR